MEQNDFKHACFVSYRNGKRVGDIPTDDLLNTFATQIFEALESELQAYFDFDEMVFLDFKCLQPGQFLIPVFSEAICHSVAFIVVYTPNYLSENKMFCASELQGRIKIEKFRNRLIGNQSNTSPILTIVLRGMDTMPKSLKTTVFADFNKFSMSTKDIKRHKKFNKKIREMVETIFSLHNQQKEACEKNGVNLFTGCEEFRILNIEEDVEREIVREFIKDMRKGGVTSPFPQM